MEYDVMARIGVNYNDVVKAIRQLKSEGKNPTIEKIRYILGTGSSSTIAKYLTLWKNEQENEEAILSKNQIPHELLSVIKALWLRLHSHSENKLLTMQKSNETFLSTFREEMGTLKRENKQLAQQCMQLSNEVKTLLQDKKRLEREVEEKQNKIVLLLSHQEKLLNKRLKKMRSKLKSSR